MAIFLYFILWLVLSVVVGFFIRITTAEDDEFMLKCLAACVLLALLTVGVAT